MKKIYLLSLLFSLSFYVVEAQYCPAAGRVGTGGDYINRVTIGSIDNVSEQTFTVILNQKKLI